MNGNQARQGADEIAILTAQPRKNYAGAFETRGVNFPCYTEKQMKSLYPDGGFEVAVEYAPKGRGARVGLLHFGKKRLPLVRFGANDRFKYRVKGYVATDAGEDSYAALLENVLVQRVAALALAAAILIAGIVLAVPLFGAADPDLPADAMGTPALPDLESGAVDWEGARIKDTGGVTQGIAIPGYKSITIAANAADVEVNFQNPEGNPCYFEISLVLADGTELYHSKMIEPGKGLYEITLTQALAPGEYDAVVKYDTFSLTDLSPMNGAEVQIKLIAE